jgi:uncharacterized membrane protein YeaQ/YmgE (transglycosylase-associated protein family)
VCSRRPPPGHREPKRLGSFEFAEWGSPRRLVLTRLLRRSRHAGHRERKLWKHTLGIILNVLVIGGLLIWLFHLAYGKVEPPTVSALHRRIGYWGRVHPPTDIIGYTDVWRVEHEDRVMTTLEQIRPFTPLIIIALNGLIAGWIVGALLGGGGLIRNLVVGLIGAFVGGMLVRYDILQLPNGLTSVTNSVPYGTQIVISTIGAAIVVLIARFLGGRSA